MRAPVGDGGEDSGGGAGYWGLSSLSVLGRLKCSRDWVPPLLPVANVCLVGLKGYPNLSTQH